MIYCCEDCGFLFQRIGAVEACPFCEGPRFSAATEEEAERLQSLLKEEIRDTKKHKDTEERKRCENGL